MSRFWCKVLMLSLVELQGSCAAWAGVFSCTIPLQSVTVYYSARPNVDFDYVYVFYLSIMVGFRIALVRTDALSNFQLSLAQKMWSLPELHFPLSSLLCSAPLLG